MNAILNLKTPKGSDITVEIEFGFDGNKIVSVEYAGMKSPAGASRRDCALGARLRANNIPVPASGDNFRYELIRTVFNGKTTLVVLDRESSERLRAENDRLSMAGEEAAFPGLGTLRAAYEVEENWREKFARAMEDEHCVKHPKRPQVDVAELQAAYPRAALYLMAEDYSFADNDRKAAAGRKAMRLLQRGGTEDEAKSILDNWLAEVDGWN